MPICFCRLVCCDGDMSVTDFLHLWEDDVEFGNQLFPVEHIAAERRAVTEKKSRRKVMQYLVKYKVQAEKCGTLACVCWQFCLICVAEPVLCCWLWS